MILIPSGSPHTADVVPDLVAVVEPGDPIYQPTEMLNLYFCLPLIVLQMEIKDPLALLVKKLEENSLNKSGLNGAGSVWNTVECVMAAGIDYLQSHILSLFSSGLCELLSMKNITEVQIHSSEAWFSKSDSDFEGPAWHTLKGHDF